MGKVGRDTGAVGPCEAAWRANFGAFEQRGLRRPRLLVVPDELPGLAYPAGLDDYCREKCFAAAIAELFAELYGAELMATAIGQWPRIVEDVAQEQYAD